MSFADGIALMHDIFKLSLWGDHPISGSHFISKHNNRESEYFDPTV